MKPGKETIPPQRGQTLRRELMERLRLGPATARELSAEIGIRERDVYTHLDHIRRSLRDRPERLEVTPCRCHSCGFRFRDRTRLDRPGRCPQCKGSSLSEAVFVIGVP